MNPGARTLAMAYTLTRRRAVLLRGSRFARFLAAGLVNTAFGFGVYWLCLRCGLPVWGALIVGNVAGIVFNFMTTGAFVFRSLLRRHFPRFVCVYLLLYGLNYAGIIGLGKVWIGPVLAQAILTIPTALLSYLLMAKFVFVVDKAALRSDDFK